VQIVLENGDLHPIKTKALFQKPYLSNVSLVAFCKVPVVGEIAVPNHAKNLLA
jgi:hypothetical protein